MAINVHCSGEFSRSGSILVLCLSAQFPQTTEPWNREALTSIGDPLFDLKIRECIRKADEVIFESSEYCSIR